MRRVVLALAVQMGRLTAVPSGFWKHVWRLQDCSLRLASACTAPLWGSGGAGLRPHCKRPGTQMCC